MKKVRKKARSKARLSALTPQPCYFDGSQDDVTVGLCDGVPGPTDYCFGCKQWICEGHSKNTGALGHGHDPYAHLKSVDDCDCEGGYSL